MKVIKAYYITCRNKAIYINCYMDRIIIFFIKNGEIHNSKYPAEIEIIQNFLNKTVYKYYYLNNKFYNSRFTNKSWKIFAKNIIRSKKLKIFK